MPRSTYYYHEANPPSDRQATERPAIVEICKKSQFRYGYRRADVPADARKKLSGGAADERPDLVPGGTAAEKPVVTDGAADSKNRLHQP